jgi:hypothetical protein
MQLMPFVSDFFVSANQRMLFGDKLFEVDSNLTWTFIDLDDRIWQLLMNVPAFLAPKNLGIQGPDDSLDQSVLGSPTT